MQKAGLEPSWKSNINLKDNKGPSDRKSSGTKKIAPLIENGEVNNLSIFIYSSASLTFQTFHTLPTKSGPGLRVVLPGFQPEGVASVPSVFLTCWKA